MVCYDLKLHDNIWVNTTLDRRDDDKMGAKYDKVASSLQNYWNQYLFN